MDRAKSENRVKNDDQYYEKHHVIPDFMFKDRTRKGPSGHLSGNPNDKNNIRLLTPREHFIAHVLLHKHLKGTHYEYPAGSALQFFFSKVSSKHPRNVDWNASENRKYEKYRLDGLQAISKARKGKMPVVDSVTGEKKGSQSINHPKVLSGEWVHHSKGKKLSKERRLEIQIQTTGCNNPNFKELTPEILDRLFNAIDLTLREGPFTLKKFVYNANFNKPKSERIARPFICNKFGSISGLIEDYNRSRGTDIKYLGKGYKRK